MESRTRIRYRNFLIVSHDGTFGMSYVTALTSFECQSKPPRSRRGSLSSVGAQGTIFRACCKHGPSPSDRLVGTRRGPLFSFLAMEPDDGSWASVFTCCRMTSDMLSSIDVQLSSVDVRGGLSAEKVDYSCDLVRIPETTHRNSVIHDLLCAGRQD